MSDLRGGADVKTGLSSFTVVPLHPTLSPNNISPANIIETRAIPVCTAGLRIDDVGKREAKEFTLRGN